MSEIKPDVNKKVNQLREMDARDRWRLIGNWLLDHAMIIIILLMALIIRLFYVAYRASTPFSALIAVGVGGMLLFQTFMNIFMNVGLLPVMGLTLPFFSYGGTSIVTMFAALGIAAGVRMREKPSWLQN